MGVKAEGSGFARVNKVTSASLGYPPLIFNKNSTSDKKERTSSEPGAFRLHYYCTPPVYVLRANRASSKATKLFLRK